MEEKFLPFKLKEVSFQVPLEAYSAKEKWPWDRDRDG